MAAMTGLGATPPGLLALYPGWSDYMQRLADAIAPLSREQLALRPASHLRSIAENAAHIIGARGRWCFYVLGIQHPGLAAYARWDDEDQPKRGAAELAQGLAQSWQVFADALAQMTPADLERTFPNPDPELGEPDVYRCGWVLWHLVEHDTHHGGEVSQLLGTHGLGGLDI